MIALQDRAYCVPGLPKDLRISYPQGIRASEGYKGTFISHCYDDTDSYAELKLKESMPGCHRDEPVKRVNINYIPKKNLSTHEAILPKQIEKEVKALASAICVNNEDNQNIAPSQKELLRWHFRLIHIGFQHVQYLICISRLKVQGNSKAMIKF